MSLDIVIGPMFSGKTSRILSLISRYGAIGKKVLVVTHSSDQRYTNKRELVSHDGQKAECIQTTCLLDVDLSHDIIIIDETQFFTKVKYFVELAVDTHQKQVYLFGLDGDYNREPFGEILSCIPLADRVEKLYAFCQDCSNGIPGLFSFRIKHVSDQVLVGGKESYKPLCRKCFLRQTGA
jgi:thymidine kinase